VAVAGSRKSARYSWRMKGGGPATIFLVYNVSLIKPHRVANFTARQVRVQVSNGQMITRLNQSKCLVRSLPKLRVFCRTITNFRSLFSNRIDEIFVGCESTSTLLLVCIPPIRANSTLNHDAVRLYCKAQPTATKVSRLWKNPRRADEIQHANTLVSVQKCKTSRQNSTCKHACLCGEMAKGVQ
jgi:ribosomal protein L32